MLVDVIVPVFNGAKYLKRCIESVIKNTYQCPKSISVNLVIVNDGSTDQTLKIAKKFEKNNDFITVLSQKNSGAASARNLGLERATGDYILFLDADDWLPDDTIRVMVENAAKSDADLVIGKSRYYLDKFPITTTPGTWHEPTPGIIDPHENNFLVEITPGIRAKLFRSDLFEDARFPLARIKWEDLAIIPALVARSDKILYLDHVVYNYTIHANTTVKDYFFKCKVLDIIKSLDLLRDNLDDFGIYGDYAREYRSILTLHTLFRAENIVTWLNASADYKKRITRKLIWELHLRYPLWRYDSVLIDPDKRYKNSRFDFLLQHLYL